MNGCVHVRCLYNSDNIWCTYENDDKLSYQITILIVYLIFLFARSQ